MQYPKYRISNMSACLAVALAIALSAGCGKDDKDDSNERETATTKSGSTESPPKKRPTVHISGIPDENPTDLQRKNEPLVKFLSEALQANVKYVPVTDYGAAVQALVAEQLDFVWLGGFTHVQSRNMADVQPLVMRDIDREFKSVFIASAESDIEKVEDIKGKKMAFGSKSSTSGRLMPSHFMIDQFNIDPSKDFDGDPVFSGAHDATVKFVESGKVDAGALNKEVWDRMVREKKVDTAKVKVIWTTPGYVDYVWTARTAVGDELRKRFTEAFLSLSPDNPKHKNVLDLQGAQKFVTANKTDFDDIEKVARALQLLKK